MASTPKKNSTGKSAISNDPERFCGTGVGFKAKIIGVDNVPEPRGDKMCQESIQKLKSCVKQSGEHKQRTIINVSLEGLKIVDEKTGAILHQHAVNKISFIARDASDSRAFGYIYGPGDGSHHFFGIKTEKAAESLVLTLRDLFQVVFEIKKKEVEEVKKLKSENEENEKESKIEEEKVEKVKKEEAPKSAVDEDDEESPEEPPECALEDLLGLESELRTLQQGIQQMDAHGGQSQAPMPHNAWANPAAAQPAQQPAFVAAPSSLPGFNSPQLVAASSTPPRATWATFDSPSPPQPQPTTAADPFNSGPFVAPSSSAGDKYAVFGNASLSSSPFAPAPVAAAPTVFGTSTGVASSPAPTAVINSGFVTSPTQPVEIPAVRDPFGDLVNALGAGEMHANEHHQKPPTREDFIKSPPKPSLAELQQGTPPVADPFGAPVSPCTEPVLGDKNTAVVVDPFDTSCVHLSAQQCRSLHLRPPKPPENSFPAEFPPPPFRASFPDPEPPNTPPPPVPPVPIPEEVPPTPPPRSRDMSPMHRARPRASLMRAATFDVAGSPPPVPQRPPREEPAFAFKPNFEARFSEAPGQLENQGSLSPRLGIQSPARRTLPRQASLMQQPMRVALPPLKSNSNTAHTMRKLGLKHTEGGSIRSPASVRSAEGNFRISMSNSKAVENSVRSSVRARSSESSPRPFDNDTVRQSDGPIERPSSATTLRSVESSMRTTENSLSPFEQSIKSSEGSLKTYDSSIRSSESGLRSREGSIRSSESGLRSREGSIRSSEGSFRSREGSIRSNEGSLRSRDSNIKPAESSTPKNEISTARPRPRSSTSNPPSEKLSRPPSAGVDPFAAVTLSHSKTEKARSRAHRNPSSCSSSSSTAGETSISPVSRPRPRPRPRSRGSQSGMTFASSGVRSDSPHDSPQNSPHVSVPCRESSPSALSLHSQNSFTVDFNAEVLTSSRLDASKQDAVSILSSEFQADGRDADAVSVASTERTARSDSGSHDPFALVDPFVEDSFKDPFELESPTDPFTKDIAQVSFKTRAVTVEDSLQPEAVGGRTRKISFNTSDQTDVVTNNDVTCELSFANDSSLFKSTSIRFEESNNTAQSTDMEESFSEIYSRCPDLPPPSHPPPPPPPPPPQAKPSFDDLLNEFLHDQLPASIPEEPKRAPAQPNWETFSASNSFSENLCAAATNSASSSSVQPKQAPFAAFADFTSSELFPCADQFSQDSSC